MAGETLTDRELAAEWDCGVRLIQRLCREGRLEGFKVGTLWRIDRPAIEAFKSRNASERVAS